MRRLGMAVSDTTILADLRQHTRTSSESGAGAAVHGAGVDDWAGRKGFNYGTIINRERRVNERAWTRSAEKAAPLSRDADRFAGLPDCRSGVAEGDFLLETGHRLLP
jgi:hypothetical protein